MLGAGVDPWPTFRAMLLLRMRASERLREAAQL